MVLRGETDPTTSSAISRSLRFVRCDAATSRSKASSAVHPRSRIKMPLAWSITGRVFQGCRELSDQLTGAVVGVEVELCDSFSCSWCVCMLASVDSC